MEVGLLVNSNNRLCSYSEKFKEILIKNNIPFILIDPNSHYFWMKLKVVPIYCSGTPREIQIF